MFGRRRRTRGREEDHIADGSGGGTPMLYGSDARSSSDGAHNGVIGTGEGIGEGDPKGCAADDTAAVQAGLDRTRVVRALSHGILNGILLSPVAVSFAAIIFRDPAFTPHLPRLAKLVVFSCSVHMACLATMSGLKYAVGSVQDAGLIFLSAIATSVATFSREKGLDEATMLSTACFMLCGCTGLLGLALVVLGRLRLASLVQYLPMPVVGGYLAFIGYFCGQAGLAFATGLEISSVMDLGKLVDSESFMLVTPAVVGGVVYYLCLRRFSSPMTLPLLLALFLGIFFAALASTGTSLEEARDLKWVSEASPNQSLFRAWDYFSLAKVEWGAVVRVIPNFLAMTVVVAFSSCLDVAAIEMEMGLPLDFNGELQIVGWSNVVSGLLGGFTGSYIFSQTIFNLRAGVNTRLAGAITSFVLVATAASPVSLPSYLPRAFFGSLLVLISVDLMVEWLWLARLRMMRAEYMVCLATFVAIQVWGVEKGMLAGLVLAALSFTISYAQVPTVMTARVRASTVMRTFEERVILQAYRQQTVVLELQGYIFFGSAVKILADVKERIVWGSEEPGPNTIEITREGRSSTGRRTASDSDTSILASNRGSAHDPNTIAVAKAAKSAKDRNSLRSNYGLPPTTAPSRPRAVIRAGEASPRFLLLPRRSPPSPQSDYPPNLLNVTSSGRNVFGDVMSPVYNRSGMAFSPAAGGGGPSDFLMRGTLSPRRRGSAGQERSVSQQQQQRQLHEGSTLTGYSTAGVDVTTSASPASGPFLWQPLTRQLDRDHRGSRWTISKGGTSGKRENDPRSVVPIGAANPQAEGAETTCRMDWDAKRSDSTEAVSAMAVASARELSYGAVEDDHTKRRDGEADPAGGVSIPNRASGRPRELSSSGEESRSRLTTDGAVQTYMSLWANGGATASDGSPCLSQSGGSSSAVPLSPRPEQRTRRVILDFSNVVGVDATAARSCFLMLKMVLRASAVEVVFSGVNPRVRSLLRSHGVIAVHDSVFDSRDTALEWAEEMILTERKAETLLRRRSVVGGGGLPSPASFLDPSDPPPRSLPGPLQHLEIPPARRAMASDLQKEFDGDGDDSGIDNDGDSFPALASTRKAEAAAFLGDNEQYYSRAGSMRRRSSRKSVTAHAGGEDGQLPAGDLGSLQSILEDYLEVDRYQVPESVRRVLGEAHRFFKEERVEAGVVIMHNTAPPEKLFFIGAGSVELQIIGELGPSGRLLKVCAGGTFGEVGFYLRTPQAFRAIAREPCHFHTLNREGMARMQRENPGLCVLVQKAVLKSICLAASISIESAHFGSVDQDRVAGRETRDINGRF